jgi:hypothetical protein
MNEIFGMIETVLFYTNICTFIFISYDLTDNILYILYFCECFLFSSIVKYSCADVDVSSCVFGYVFLMLLQKEYCNGLLYYVSYMSAAYIVC